MGEVLAALIKSLHLCPACGAALEHSGAHACPARQPGSVREFVGKLAELFTMPIPDGSCHIVRGPDNSDRTWCGNPILPYTWTLLERTVDVSPQSACPACLEAFNAARARRS